MSCRTCQRVKRGATIFAAGRKTSVGCRPYLLEIFTAGERHDTFSRTATSNGADMQRIEPELFVMDERSFRFARPRRRPGHRQQLHPTHDGYSGLWSRCARDRRRIDRRGARALERDDFSSSRLPALSFCVSMISAQTRSAIVARENRYPLFRIML